MDNYSTHHEWFYLWLSELNQHSPSEMLVHCTEGNPTVTCSFYFIDLLFYCHYFFPFNTIITIEQGTVNISMSFICGTTCLITMKP